MKKATRILGYVLLVSGLNLSLAAAQTSAPPSSSKFIPVKPLGGTIPTGIVLSGIRPLIDPPSLGYRPTTGTPLYGVFRPVSGWPSLGVPKPKPFVGVLPRPGVIPFTDQPKVVTLSDVQGYDR